MMSFNDTTPLDRLYMKVAGDRHLQQLPLCELDLPRETNFDPKLSNRDLIVMIEPKENGKTFKYSREAFQKMLQESLFNNTLKVADFVIQPGGEAITPETREFLEKYN